MKSKPICVSDEHIKKLIKWYKESHRDLPWRRSRNAYLIWISEVMLQQTTVAAVKPYFDRFALRFPTVHTLAESSLDDVYEQWSGLGYYSRARNLHRAAKILSQTGFPKTADQLIELPGFGPYTSRAVSSLAFDEPVGVLDGNVIRFLCRFHGLALEWWKTSPRKELQRISDQWAAPGSSADVNQALMEMGATLCTASSPRCQFCPLASSCVARAQNSVDKLPLKKIRGELNYWIWKLDIQLKKDKLRLVRSEKMRFFKNSWVMPGELQCVTPGHFEKASQKKNLQRDFVHSITNNKILVQPRIVRSGAPRIAAKTLWVATKELSRYNPSSLFKKALRLSSETNQNKSS